MKTYLLKFLWIIPIFAILQSCNLNEALNIHGPLDYNPTFSVPVGKFEMSFNDIFNNMGLVQTDTISGTDTLQRLWYENNLYFDPKGYYDTSFFADFNFNFLNSQNEVIKSIMFKMNYKSELPCNSTLQLYFENAGGNILDSLYADGPLLIPAADTNQSGFVESAYPRQKDVFFGTDNINMLQQVSRLEFHTIIYTKHNVSGYYKFLSNYMIFFQMGIRVEIEAKI